ncbi:MAG: cereblon family protein [Pseudomonadota bacterium]|nr:cereblon family protein [Pseudomonadota bacterium]
MTSTLAFKLRDDGESIEALLPRRKAADAGAGTDRRRLLCAACGLAVTGVDNRIHRDGAHEHRFANPLGLEFRIGCFDAAPGCALIGQATGEHTWFAGFAWRIGLCRRCGTHLGWGYRGGGEGFFGLILDRLRQAD